jgi:mitochondrial fission protein ELM1
MPPLAILILTDGRPGHYHLSEGVAAAIGRRRDVYVQRREISRRKIMPGRLLAGALRLALPPDFVLCAGYGLTAGDVPRADLVISAGGDTLSANVAAARLLGVPNIYCGTLRHLPPDEMGLVVSSYARHIGLPRHLVGLKPSGIDPDTLPSRDGRPQPGPGAPPRRAGLLIGGPSGLFRWQEDEWLRLIRFLADSHRAHGMNWIVSTSRRTPDFVADRLLDQSRSATSGIAQLIDFRLAGPGTLPVLFAQVDAVLATEDSSTMLSEAVCARLPVVGVAPREHDFKDDEREYRALLTTEGWCRSLALSELTPDTFLGALEAVRPLAINHLDRLAAQLEERLPALFSSTTA